jgi:Protein of unknown function (DUF3016)
MLLSVCLLTSGWVFAAERVEVSFVGTEQFADFGQTRWDRDRNEKALAEMFQRAGQALPVGQQLSIKVIDVNLAGDLDWWRSRDDRVRVMRNVTWPSLVFEYRLSEAGQVLKADTVRLTDMAYLQAFLTAAQREDVFPYERRMVDRWLRSDLPKR